MIVKKKAQEMLKSLRNVMNNSHARGTIHMHGCTAQPYIHICKGLKCCGKKQLDKIAVPEVEIAKST